MKLIPVNPANDDHVRILFECFLSRPDDARISSSGRLPTLAEHCEFVAHHPYEDWCLIELDANEHADGTGLFFVGAIALTPAPRPSVHGHEIGVDILPDYRGNHYADRAIRLMMEKHGSSRYMAHCARDNYASMALFKRLGFEQVQVTFVHETA